MSDPLVTSGIVSNLTVVCPVGWTKDSLNVSVPEG